MVPPAMPKTGRPAYRPDVSAQFLGHPVRSEFGVLARSAVFRMFSPKCGIPALPDGAGFPTRTLQAG